MIHNRKWLLLAALLAVAIIFIPMARDVHVTNNRIPSLSTENPAASTVAPSSSLFRSSAPEQPPSVSVSRAPSEVIAFYHHKYGFEKQAWRGKSAAHRTEDPLMGYYDSVDRRVLDQHIEWAVSHGITALCIVMPQNSLTKGNKVLHEISQATMLGKIKIMLHLQNPNFSSEMGGSIKSFFNQEWYLRIKGNPAISVGDQRFPLAGSTLADDVRAALGDMVYLIGHDLLTLRGASKISGSEIDLALSGRKFDAHTLSPTNMFAKGKMPQTVLAAMVEQGLFQLYEQLSLKNHYCQFAPTLVARCRDAQLLSNNDQFRQQIREVLMSVNKQQAQADMLFVSSFNNYHDGSEIEPTERFGFQYLEALRAEIAPTLPQLPDTALQHTRRHWAVNSDYRHRLVEAGRVPATGSSHIGPVVPIADALSVDSSSIDNTKQRPLVMAYYYMWYGEPKLNPITHWHYMRRREDPLIGLYESLDPHVVEHHIEWALAHGIEAFVVSFDQENWRSIHATLSNVSNINKIKIILLYETIIVNEKVPEFPDVRLEWDNPRHANYVLDLLGDVAALYFKEPWYLHIEGRPAMEFYVTRVWKHFNHRHMNRIRAKIGNFFAIGDEVFWGMAPDAQIALGKTFFDSYTAYNMYEPIAWWITDGQHSMDGQGDDVNNFLSSTDTIGKWRQWANKTQFIPHILSRYHDFRPLHPPLLGSASSFRKNIQRAKSLPQPPMEGEYNSLFFVVSFNEYYEDTSVEPTEQFGFERLELIRQELAPQRPKQTYDVDSIRSTKHFKKYRTRLVDSNYLGRGRVTPGDAAYKGRVEPLSNLGAELRPLAIADYSISFGRLKKKWTTAIDSSLDAPVMGHYESADVRILNQHVDWAAASGIGAFSVLFESASDVDLLEKLLRRADGLLDTRLFFTAKFHPLFFNASTRSSDGLDWDTASPIAELLERVAALLKSHYWLHLDGKPVVVLQAGSFKLSSRFMGVLKQVFSEAYLVIECDEIPTSQSSEKGIWRLDNTFNALTSTNEIAVQHFSNWMSAADSLGLRWIPRIVPRRASIEREAFKHHIAVHSNITQKPFHNFSSAFFYSSFNSFEEGTALEPTDETGFQFLEWFREEQAPHRDPMERIVLDHIGRNDHSKPYTVKDINEHWSRVSPYRHRLERARDGAAPATSRLRSNGVAAKDEVVLFASFRFLDPMHQEEIAKNTFAGTKYKNPDRGRIHRQLHYLENQSAVTAIVVNVNELPVMQEYANFLYFQPFFNQEEKFLKIAWQIDLAVLDPSFNHTHPMLSRNAVKTLRNALESFWERPHFFLKFDGLPVVLYRARSGPVTHEMMGELNAVLGEHISIGDIGGSPDAHELIVDGIPIFDVYTTFSWVEDAAINSERGGAHDNFNGDMTTFLTKSGAFEKMQKWAATPGIAYVPPLSPGFVSVGNRSKYQFPELILRSSEASFREQVTRVRELQRSSRLPGGVAGMYFIDSANDELHGTSMTTEQHVILKEMLPTKQRW